MPQQPGREYYHHQNRLGIDISKIKDLQKNTSERCGQIPKGYDFYLWFKGDGYNNMGDWIEKAA